MTKDLIIRYYYVALAPYFKRDLNYFLASDEEKYRQYKLGFIDNTPDIVCSTISDYYVKLYNRLGIEAFKIQANSAKIPLYALLVHGDLGWYYLNPIGDLFNNQYNLNTTEFGIIPSFNTIKSNYPFIVVLDKDYINELDKTLNLPETYNNYFKLLHLEATDKNISSKFFNISKDDYDNSFIKRIEYMNKYLINLGNVKGPFERIEMYLYLSRVLFNKASFNTLNIKLNNLNNPIISYNNNDIIYEEIYNDKYKLIRRK